jgi:hypothetical protein
MPPHRLLRGPLLHALHAWPLTVPVLACDLRSRFLVKERVGTGYRAIARNGRVLLATDAPLHELTGQPAQLRLQDWQRATLPGDQPETYGVLLCLRRNLRPSLDQLLLTHLVATPEEGYDLVLDVGGGLSLEVRAPRSGKAP